MIIQIKNSKQLGSVARQIRKHQKLRQDDFAAMAGSSHKFLGEMEKGKPTVQLEKALKVLEELGIDVYLDLPVSDDFNLSIPE